MTNEADGHQIFLGLRDEIGELERRMDDLRSQYRRAGASVKDDAVADVETIQQMRSEAENLVRLLRGGSLFGRYASDADHHRRSANAWRLLAVTILLVAAALDTFLAVGPPAANGWQLIAPTFPLVLLFTYASIESFNHRRREFDRRRIYLRMAAIESYTQSPVIVGASKSELDGILRKFIERHFIEPDLDPNDLSSVTASGIWRPKIGRRGPVS